MCLKNASQQEAADEPDIEHDTQPVSDVPREAQVCLHHADRQPLTLSVSAAKSPHTLMLLS